MRVGIVVSICVLILACEQAPQAHHPQVAHETSQPSQVIKNHPFRGALLSTRFQSLDELREVLDISYSSVSHHPYIVNDQTQVVRVYHRSAGSEVCSILKAGMSERELSYAQRNGFSSKLLIAVSSWKTLGSRHELSCIFDLAKKRKALYGESDVAFFHLAEEMACHIDAHDAARLPLGDFTEKGFLNTFNHMTAQAIMTTLFSADVANFVAELHERKNLPELISGDFSPQQLADLEEGPVDNYVDMINNKWGQKLGQQLKEKYQINGETNWTPALLTAYLNDIQNYYSWAFHISFRPFLPSDELVCIFARKINFIMQGKTLYTRNLPDF